MDVEKFKQYLKKNGRSKSAIDQIMSYLGDFHDFYKYRHPSRSSNDVTILDLEDFVAEIESFPNKTAKKHLWALAYGFEFLGKQDVLKIAREMREERIKRVPFKLANFMGVDAKHIERLSKVGIENVNQMMKAGRTVALRMELAKKTGVPLDYIVEIVKLSDLTRIGAIRSIRARLYFNAGVDTPEKMAAWDPVKLREMLLGFIEETGFQGIAPLPKEAQNAVSAAKKLDYIVEY